jgi:hypothetical protein
MFMMGAVYFGMLYPQHCKGDAFSSRSSMPQWHPLATAREDRILLIMAAVSDVCDVFKLMNDGYVAEIVPCKGRQRLNFADWVNPQQLLGNQTDVMDTHTLHLTQNHTKFNIGHIQ